MVRRPILLSLFVRAIICPSGVENTAGLDMCMFMIAIPSGENFSLITDNYRVLLFHEILIWLIFFHTNWDPLLTYWIIDSYIHKSCKKKGLLELWVQAKNATNDIRVEMSRKQRQWLLLYQRSQPHS